jgi:DNA-binding MarR family transcriptional regulator
MDYYRELFLMQQTYATLFSLINKIQTQGDKYLASLTSRQLMTMIAMMHLPEEETTLNNIARKLGTTKQSVKQLITALEKKGYVVTTPSRQDKRAVNVTITDSGKRVMMECSEKGIYFFLDLFKDFTGEEMECLWTLLKKLYRFDGEMQDGFEEETNMEMGEEQEIIQKRIMHEFAKRRNNPEKRASRNP